MPLKFGLDRFDFDFVLAAVKMPILGIDFFKHHSLLVDAASHQVLAAATLKPIGSGSGLTAALSATNPAIRQLLAEFPTILNDGSGAWRGVSNSVKHVIETKGRPVTAKARRLDPAKHKTAAMEFAKLE